VTYISTQSLLQWPPAVTDFGNITLNFDVNKVISMLCLQDKVLDTGSSIISRRSMRVKPSLHWMDSDCRTKR